MVVVKPWSLADKKRKGLIPQFVPKAPSISTPPTGATYSVDVSTKDSFNIDPNKSTATKTYSNPQQVVNGKAIPINPSQFPKGIVPQTATIQPKYSGMTQVATKNTPFVYRPTTRNANIMPQVDYTDILQLDKQGLQDYIDMADIMSKQGKALGVENEFKLRKAAGLLQNMNATEQKNPYDDAIKSIQDQMDEIRMTRQNDVNSLSDLERQRLDAKFNRDAEATQRSGERVKQSVQSALSFSGFGRSTFNADKQQEIQENVEWIIQWLANTRDLEYQAYQMKLNGATNEELAPYVTQIAQMQADSKKYLIDSAIKINQEQNKLGLDTQTRVENIIKFSNSLPQWDYESLDPKTQKKVDNYAKSVINANGDIDENLLKSIESPLLWIVLQRAGENRKPKEEFQFIAADKYWPDRVWNKTTWQIIRDPNIVNQYRGKVWAWVWGTWAGTVQWNDMLDRLNRIKTALSWNEFAPLSTVLMTPDVKADIEFLKNTLALWSMAEAKKKGITFGSMTNAEWDMLKKSQIALNPLMQKDSSIREVNRLITWLGWNPANNSAWNTNTNKINLPPTKWSTKEWVNKALSLMD